MIKTTADDLLNQGIRILTSVSDSARLDAEVLLDSACNIDRISLAKDGDQLVSKEKVSQFESLISRRLAGEPIAYLTGNKEFWSLNFKVDANTLIPRPETEILVEAVLQTVLNKNSVSIVDLGTGSGAVAIALASELPNAKITGTDICDLAIIKARENAKCQNLDIKFLCGDWLSPVTGILFDVIVSNPPYVSDGDQCVEKLSKFEPPKAFFSGVDGLNSIRQICPQAFNHLNTYGLIALEHSDPQKNSVVDILKSSGFKAIEQIKDYAGKVRVTTAIKP